MIRLNINLLSLHTNVRNYQSFRGTTTNVYYCKLAVYKLNKIELSLNSIFYKGIWRREIICLRS